MRSSIREPGQDSDMGIDSLVPESHITWNLDIYSKSL